MQNQTKQGKNVGRSILSVVAGFVVIFVLSYATDYILSAFGVFNPSEALPLYGSELLVAIILAYRIAFSVVGAYITARIAPRNPMRHALILGAIGLVFSTLGAIAGMQQNLGPAWYLWGLAVLALPAAWLGGKIFAIQQGKKA